MRFLLYIISGFLCVVACVFALPQLFGYEVYAVVSESMQPEYMVGSIIFTKQLPPEQVEVGDCITYRDNDRFITHRVIGIDRGNQEFQTKGDSNRMPDRPVGYDRLVGRTSAFKIPYLGYIAVWIHKGAGGALIVISASVCIIRLRRRKTKDARKAKALFYRTGGGRFADKRSKTRI